MRREERRLEIEALESSSKTIYTLKDLKRLKKLFFVEKEHIKVGYRANHNMTFGMCCQSLCQVHNETGNIYTHMLPAIYILI